MGGIFINYRRDQVAAWAGRLYELLVREFPGNQVKMDVNAIEPGLDFVEALNHLVSGCDVLLAVIGPGWEAAKNDNGSRRLEDPDDFVRIEIASALKRGIRVIPVLVDGARLPTPDSLPEEIRPLSRRQAAALTHERFKDDCRSLVDTVSRVLAENQPQNDSAAISPSVGLGKDSASAEFHFRSAPHAGRADTGRDQAVERLTWLAVVYATSALPMTLLTAAILGEFYGRRVSGGVSLELWHLIYGAALSILLGGAGAWIWRREARALHHALIWLGTVATLILVCIATFSSMNWYLISPPLYTYDQERIRLFQLGSAMVCAFLISAALFVPLLSRFRKTLSGEAISIIWLGLVAAAVPSLGLSFQMIGNRILDHENSIHLGWLIGASLAVASACFLLRRNPMPTPVEMAIYWCGCGVAICFWIGRFLGARGITFFVEGIVLDGGAQGLIFGIPATIAVGAGLYWLLLRPLTMDSGA